MNCVHYAMDTIVVAQMSFAATPPEHLTRSFQMGLCSATANGRHNSAGGILALYVCSTS